MFYNYTTIGTFFALYHVYIKSNDSEEDAPADGLIYSPLTHQSTFSE